MEETHCHLVPSSILTHPYPSCMPQVRFVPSSISLLPQKVSTKKEKKSVATSSLFAEGEGFKPPIPEKGIPDFESSAIDHSANLPFLFCACKITTFFLMHQIFFAFFFKTIKKTRKPIGKKSRPSFAAGAVVTKYLIDYDTI